MTRSKQYDRARRHVRNTDRQLQAAMTDLIVGAASKLALMQPLSLSAKPLVWPAAAAQAIADNQQRYAHAERDRIRYVLAKFLQKTIELREDGVLDLDETAYDLRIGECGLVDYIDDLIAESHRLQPILRAGLWKLALGDEP